MTETLVGPDDRRVRFATEEAYDSLQRAKGDRKRALFQSCGCSGGVSGPGLDGEGPALWTQEWNAEGDVDGDYLWRLDSLWCSTHGPEFCEAIFTGKRPQ